MTKLVYKNVASVIGNLDDKSVTVPSPPLVRKCAEEMREGGGGDMCRGRRRESSTNDRLDIIRKKDAHKKTQTAFAFPPKWRCQSRKRNSLRTLLSLLFFIFFYCDQDPPPFLQIGSKRRRRQKKSGSDLLHFPPVAKRIARKEKEKKDTGSPFLPAAKPSGPRTVRVVVVVVVVVVGGAVWWSTFGSLVLPP